MLLWCFDTETKEEVIVLIRELEELGKDYKRGDTKPYWTRRMKGTLEQESMS